MIKKKYFKINSIKEIEQTIISSGLNYIQYTTVKRAGAGYKKHTFKQSYPIGSPFTLSVIEDANGECKFDISPVILKAILNPCISRKLFVHLYPL